MPRSDTITTRFEEPLQSMASSLFSGMARDFASRLPRFPRAFASLFLAAGLGLALTAIAPPAEAKRIALVIGNSRYGHTDPLTNPANDGAAVSQRLTDLGFDVTSDFDLGIARLRSEISAFKRKVADGDTVVIYYAGHGMEVNGSDYLLPVDADLQIPSDVDDQGYPLDHLFFTERKNINVIIVFDACRDNAFVRKTHSNEAGTGTIDVPDGVMVIFSAAPREVALDGDPGTDASQSRNSVFANAMLNSLASPGLNETDLVKEVRRQVREHSQGQQNPRVIGLLNQTVTFNPSRRAMPAPTDVASNPPVSPPPETHIAPPPEPTPTVLASNDTPPQAVTRHVEAPPTSSVQSPTPQPEVRPQPVQPRPEPTTPPPQQYVAPTQQPQTQAAPDPGPRPPPVTQPPAQDPPARSPFYSNPPPTQTTVSASNDRPPPTQGPPPLVQQPFNDQPLDPMLLTINRVARNPQGVFTIANLGDKVLPRRPTLQPVPVLKIPASFCSQVERNSFHDRLYVPARTTAYANNDAAGQYITNLDALRREYQSADNGFYVVVVKESQDYKRVADQQLVVSNQYLKLFDTIMDTPIKDCH